MVKLQEHARRFGKHDMERLGLFIEMPYMNGKGYVSPFKALHSIKGKQMCCPRIRLKNGTMHGYFDNEFKRIYIGEAIPLKKNANQKKATEAPKKKKGLGGPFIPAGSVKKHATPGDHYGTFAGKIEAFSRLLKYIEEEPKKKKKNFYTNPGKFGGPGYIDICFSKYPEHSTDLYGAKFQQKQYGRRLGGALRTVVYPRPYFTLNPYFEEKPGPTYVAPKVAPVAVVGDGRWFPTGPAKWPGGCHAGTLSRYPEHKTDRDKKKEDKLRKAKLKKKPDEGVQFLPHSLALKFLYTRSVLLQNTDICVNVTNYKTYEPNYTKRLLN